MKENKSYFKIFLEALSYALCLFVIVAMAAYVGFSFTHMCYIVEGASMQPYLNASIERTSATDSVDAVYVDKLKDAQDLDVVIIKNGEESIIKRVIASGGEYVSIIETDNSFYIYRIDDAENFSTLEDYKLIETEENFGYTIEYDYWNNIASVTSGRVEYEYKFYQTFLTGTYETRVFDGVTFVYVPEDSYFCLGDNREFSSDSRDYGFFSKSAIEGVVVFEVYNYSFSARISALFNYFLAQIEVFFAR